LWRRPWPNQSSLEPVAAHRAIGRLTRAPAARAFLTRASSCDFAPEGYDATWTRRATPADLTDMGRMQLGLQPW
jgi:hypothetical protein